MANGIVAIREEVEARVVHLAERPIDFETFLDLNHNHDMELIDGVMVQKMAAQLEHERLLAWLFWLLYGYVQQKNLGIVLGSRTTVMIDSYHGRLPDLLFVRQENSGIVQQRAIYGTPDMTLEIISPNDRPSDIIAVETDYYKIGVPEIIFIDQQKQQVRLLHKRVTDQNLENHTEYTETILTSGEWKWDTIPGFTLQVEWLFTDPRPNEFSTLNSLLSEK